MPADQPAASPDAVETLIQRCLQGDQRAWDLIVRLFTAWGEPSELVSGGVLRCVPGSV